MTKTDIAIYRGLKEKFDPEVHVGFFITSDTGELLIGDQSLGQAIIGWEINDGVLKLKLNTGKDILVTFPEATETVKGLLSAADKAQLNALHANLDSKVDKVTGKSLLADSEIEKLAGLPNSIELTNSIATAKAAGDNAQSDLDSHKLNKSNPHGVTKAQVGLGNVTNDAQVKRSEMGVAKGVATLDADGKVPATQLPSYVDDIIDVYATYSKSDTGVLSNVTLYLDAAHTKLVTGEAGKIYQNVADGEPQYQFRWTGTIFSQTGASSLILGEVTGTAYDGAKGKANADNIAKIKGTSLSHIKDAAPITTAADKVSLNYECFEGNQYGAAGTAHTADIPAATTAKAGVMSAADKTKLENLNSKLVVADEEDVTAVDGKIKFKDRGTTNGMGYKILRLPENGILTQDMINEANTIYEIRYNFDLNGATITVPENCTLKFEGGKLSNGSLLYDDTIILGDYKFSQIQSISGQCICKVIDLKNIDFTKGIEELKFAFKLKYAKTIILKENHEYLIDTAEVGLNALVINEGIVSQKILGNNSKIVDSREKSTLLSGGSLHFFDLIRYNSCKNISISDITFECSDPQIETLVDLEYETFGLSFLVFNDSESINLTNIGGKNLCNGIALTRCSHIDASILMNNVGYNAMLNYVQFANIQIQTYQHAHRVVYSGGVSHSEIRVEVMGENFSATASGVVLQDYLGKNSFEHNHDNTYDFKVYANFGCNFLVRLLVYNNGQFSKNRNLGYSCENLNIRAELFNQREGLKIYDSTMTFRTDNFPIYFSGKISLICHETEETSEDIYPIYIAAGSPLFNNTYYNFDVLILSDGSVRPKKMRASNLLSPSQIRVFGNSLMLIESFSGSPDYEMGSIISHCAIQYSQRSEKNQNTGIETYSFPCTCVYRGFSMVPYIRIKNGVRKVYSGFKEAFLERCEFPEIQTTSGLNINFSEIADYVSKFETRRVSIFNTSENDINISVLNFAEENGTYSLGPNKNILFDITIQNHKAYIKRVTKSAVWKIIR